MLRSTVESIARQIGLARAMGLVLTALFVAVRLWDPAPLQILQLKTFDIYQQIKPWNPPARPVIIVDIDEDSLEAHGQWPWSRDVVADLVERIGQLGATAIAFDILFPEPDRMSPAEIAKHLLNLEDGVRRRLQTLPSNDQLLAEAMGTTRVVLGQSGYGGDAGAEGGASNSVVTLGGDPRPFLVSLPSLLSNLPELEAAAAGRGLVTVQPELDGVVRRVPAIMSVAGQTRPALSIELLRVAMDEQSIVVRSDAAGVRRVMLGSVAIPTDRNGQLWVRFSGHDPDRFISATDVLEGRLPDGALEDTLVLIGTSAIGLFDIKATPLDPNTPGVEIHAQLLENILGDGLLHRPNYALGSEVAMALAICLLMVALVPMLGARLVFALGLAIAFVLFVGSWQLYDRRSILIDPVFPLLASGAVYLLLVFVNYVREENQRAAIRAAFGQYISRDLIDQLASNPDRLVLGGEAREITLLFCDVRKFTTISEQYKDDPQGLTSLMNRFLTPLTRAIMEEHGTIDKYMGDAIMAFWNAPIDLDEHAAHACDATLEMLTQLERLNGDLEREAEAAGRGFMALRIGIGLNTGTSLVGNLGSDLRFDYSALGDAVNLASRIEGLTKTYGVSVLAGERTVALAPRHAFVEADLIKVMGKAIPERIFALVGGPEVRQSPEFAEFQAHHDRGISSYRDRDWEGALAAFAKAEMTMPSAGLDVSAIYELYRKRIEDYSAAAPAGDWTGVEVATEK
ncbi:MAG: CHASE2 domain-containing protein, partial [Hyphomicrobiales bacterium]